MIYFHEELLKELNKKYLSTVNNDETNTTILSGVFYHKVKGFCYKCWDKRRSCEYSKVIGKGIHDIVELCEELKFNYKEFCSKYNVVDISSIYDAKKNVVDKKKFLNLLIDKIEDNNKPLLLDDSEIRYRLPMEGYVKDLFRSFTLSKHGEENIMETTCFSLTFKITRPSDTEEYLRDKNPKLVITGMKFTDYGIGVPSESDVRKCLDKRIPSELLDAVNEDIDELNVTYI